VVLANLCCLHVCPCRIPKAQTIKRVCVTGCVAIAKQLTELAFSHHGLVNELPQYDGFGCCNTGVILHLSCAPRTTGATQLKTNDCGNQERKKRVFPKQGGYHCIRPTPMRMPLKMDLVAAIQGSYSTRHMPLWIARNGNATFPLAASAHRADLEKN